MLLNGNIRISVNGILIDSKVLEADRRRWKGRALLPGITPGKYDTQNTLRALLYETIPVIIHARNGEELQLQGNFQRYPYKVHLARGGVIYRTTTMEVYGLGLYPVIGIVERVELGKSSHVAVADLSMRSDGLSVCFGNGSVQFELTFLPSLSPATAHPPSSYTHEYTINDEDAFD